MRNRLGRVVNERSTGKHDADLLPARRGNKCRYWVLGTRYVEQTGDVSSVRNDPALTTAHRSTGSQTEKAIADRKSQLIDRFAKRIETLRGKDPRGISGWFEQTFHFPATPVRRDGRSQGLCFQDCLVGPLQSGACYGVDARGLAFIDTHWVRT